MKREDCRLKMRVRFGRPNGEQTLGEIVKINPTKAKVAILENRGTQRDSPAGAVWTVPYSLMRPADQATAAAVAAQAKARVEAYKVEFNLAQEPERVGHEGRHDVDFVGTVTIKGKPLPAKLHLFRLGEPGDRPGYWYPSLDLNAGAQGDALRDVLNLPEYCQHCHRGSDVAKATAAVLFPWLAAQGYQLVSRLDVHEPWWLFDVTVDQQGPVSYGRSNRRFYHRKSRDVVCPIHGCFRQVKDESSF